MIIIKRKVGSDIVEHYIEPEVIKMLKKISSRLTTYPKYWVKLDDEWLNIEEVTFNEIITYKNAITRQKIMDNILDGKN
jgi:hypothetical protein